MTNGPKTILKLDARGWYDHVAQIIAAGDTSQFPAVLVQALRHVVPFDYAVFFAYRGQERPICPYDTFTPQQRIVFVTDYLEGPYLLDPFYQVYVDRMEPGLYRLREIAPDRFYHSEYFRSYYRRTGLAEEIGFMVSLPHDMMLVISLMRAGTSAPFSDRDMNKLRRMEPIVHASAARHWRNLGYLRSSEAEEETARPPLNLQVTSAFENFGEGVLTRREREVVRMVLRGHSSNSIGRQFQITTGTVKIHRKNIYAKLGISSQSELFSHFISYLSGIVEPNEALGR
jgi:DNA-binding CsgD family transcriptional regulator